MLFRLSLFNTSSPTQSRAGDFLLFTYRQVFKAKMLNLT
nr:MAG TPA: hypothetical protein [Caudoviricetes sp.]